MSQEERKHIACYCYRLLSFVPPLCPWMPESASGPEWSEWSEWSLSKRERGRKRKKEREREKVGTCFQIKCYHQLQIHWKRGISFAWSNLSNNTWFHRPSTYAFPFPISPSLPLCNSQWNCLSASDLSFTWFDWGECSQVWKYTRSAKSSCSSHEWNFVQVEKRQNLLLNWHTHRVTWTISYFMSHHLMNRKEVERKRKKHREMHKEA